MFIIIEKKIYVCYLFLKEYEVISGRMKVTTLVLFILKQTGTILVTQIFMLWLIKQINNTKLFTYKITTITSVIVMAFIPDIKATIRLTINFTGLQFIKITVLSFTLGDGTFNWKWNKHISSL